MNILLGILLASVYIVFPIVVFWLFLSKKGSVFLNKMVHKIFPQSFLISTKSFINRWTRILETLLKTTLGIVMICAVIYAIIIGFRGIDLGFLHSEISLYPEYNGKALPRMDFKVNANTQTVIESTDGTLTRLQNCVVVDRKNWHCDQGWSGTGFTNGTYFGSEYSSDTKFISKFQWNLLPKYLNKSNI